MYQSPYPGDYMPPGYAGVSPAYLGAPYLPYGGYTGAPPLTAIGLAAPPPSLLAPSASLSAPGALPTHAAPLSYSVHYEPISREWKRLPAEGAGLEEGTELWSWCGRKVFVQRDPPREPARPAREEEEQEAPPSAYRQQRAASEEDAALQRAREEFYRERKRWEEEVAAARGRPAPPPADGVAYGEYRAAAPAGHDGAADRAADWSAWDARRAADDAAARRAVDAAEAAMKRDAAAVPPLAGGDVAAAVAAAAEGGSAVGAVDDRPDRPPEAGLHATPGDEAGAAGRPITPAPAHSHFGRR
eukprot:PLAT9803.1.p2 GENE.PLAT9803.1~~PLAT9803.1.p2  ORF type:complete len:312 (-),score=81.03 PLAT9803.1:73-975(-)